MSLCDWPFSVPCLSIVVAVGRLHENVKKKRSGRGKIIPEQIGFVPGKLVRGQFPAEEESSVRFRYIAVEFGLSFCGIPAEESGHDVSDARGLAAALIVGKGGGLATEEEVGEVPAVFLGDGSLDGLIEVERLVVEGSGQ